MSIPPPQRLIPKGCSPLSRPMMLSLLVAMTVAMAMAVK
jgi:hypothetical protein